MLKALRIDSVRGRLTLFYVSVLAVALVIVGALIYVYRRVRRRRIGPAAVGLFYEMLSEDKRNAVELIVEDKAEERDPERATDKKR